MKWMPVWNQSKQKAITAAAVIAFFTILLARDVA